MMATDGTMKLLFRSTIICLACLSAVFAQSLAPTASLSGRVLSEEGRALRATDVNGWMAPEKPHPFKYYPAGTKFDACITTKDGIEGILKQKDGAFQCGAFALLFQQALAVNGIDAQRIFAYPKSADIFLVKNWQIPYPPPLFSFPSGNPSEMVTDPPTNQYGGGTTSLTGVRGQNSDTPSEKAFGNHVFVRYKGTCYDPSYGLSYTDETTFEQRAIAGFLTHTTTFNSFVVALPNPTSPKISFDELDASGSRSVTSGCQTP